MTTRAVAITPDILKTGFHSVHLPHVTNGYRNIATNADGLEIMMSREELKALKERLNEMDLE